MVSILEYAEVEHARVEGWMGASALGLTTMLSAHQVERGVKGAVGEIGVHHGKYFIGLALMRQPTEYAVAIDLFEDQHLNIDWSGRGDREIFSGHLERLGLVGEDVVLHKANSLDLTAESLLQLSGHQKYRLFSIDGGHYASIVLSDLALVESVLDRFGIAILDDFYNADWPGVNEGLFKYLPQGQLRALAYGDNKLFLCRDEVHEQLLAWMRDTVVPASSYAKLVELDSVPCYHLHAPTVAQASAGLMAKLG